MCKNNTMLRTTTIHRFSTKNKKLEAELWIIQYWFSGESSVSVHGFDIRIDQESREGRVTPLVAVNCVSVFLLTVQPDAVSFFQWQQQTLTLHLSPSWHVLIENHGPHLPSARHQLHWHRPTRVFPHSKCEVVRTGEVAGETSGCFVKMAAYVNVFDIKRESFSFTTPSAFS